MTESTQPFRPSMVSIADDEGARSWCSVIIDDTDVMPVYCEWVAAFRCEHFAGLHVCAEHYDQRPSIFAITRKGATRLFGQPRMAVQLDRLLDRLDTEEDDNVRADLLEEVFSLCDRKPSLAKVARDSGIPA
jgi:hypothetical protein